MPTPTKNGWYSGRTSRVKHYCIKNERLSICGRPLRYFSKFTGSRPNCIKCQHQLKQIKTLGEKLFLEIQRENSKQIKPTIFGTSKV